METLTHEVVGHKGLRAVIPAKELDAFLDYVYAEHSGDKFFREIAEKYNFGQEVETTDDYGEATTVWQIDDVAKRREAAEEYIAHLAERGVPKPSWWKAFLQRIRELLAKLPWSRDVSMTDNQIEAVLARASRSQQKHWYNRPSSVIEGNSGNAGNGAVRFAADGQQAYYQIPFKQGLQRVVDPAQKDNRAPVFVSETPEVFRQIGFTALPMMMNARHLRLNYYTRAEFEQNFGTMRQGEHAHGLHNVLERLPKALEHPLAVVKNLTPNAKPGSVVAITDMDVNGQKVVVPVLIEAVSDVENQYIDSHLVLTVYDSSDWVNTFLTPAIKAERDGIGIFYFDEKKANRYNAYSKKIGVIPTGFVHNIAQAGINVKPQTETLQFKRWFGKSKAVDTDGKPLVVYRRDDENFTVFDIDKTQKTDAGFLGKGFYFYGDKAEAEGPAAGYGKNLRAFYLKAENPYYISQEEVNALAEANDKTKSAEFVEHLKEEGYDSVYWNGDLDIKKISPEAESNRGGVVKAALPVQSPVIKYNTFFEKFKPVNDLLGLKYKEKYPEVRFSIADYSDSDSHDIVAILKPYIGSNIRQSREEIKAYLDSKGVHIPEKDAWAFAVMAKKAFMNDLRIKGNERREQWFYDNFPFYAAAVDWAGKDFVIVPSQQYRTQDYSGSWIAKEFREKENPDRIWRKFFSFSPDCS